MKRLLILSIVVSIFFHTSKIFGESLDDIRNKLDKKQNQGTTASAYSNGKRFKILSLTRAKQLPDSMDNEYFASLVVKIKKKSKEEKNYNPGIVKLYAYDRKGILIKVLEQYSIQTASNTDNSKGFKVNKIYRLNFRTDYEVFKKAKTYIAVVGTSGEEVVAKMNGKGKMEDFDFPEKTYLNQK